MKKQDITMYNDSELSNWVFNDEGLYNERHNIDSLMSIVDEVFIYTQEQKDELILDLETEENDNAAN